MATVFKTLNNNDVVSTRTLLHEAIPLTGTILSGTYVAADASTNVKTFGHGMFQSVYDYPYLSSSANHVLDISVGYSANSVLSASTSTQNSKKINIYNQMAQVLVGHDITGSIMRFDQNGDLTEGDKLDEVVFLNFSRLITKDEIKKGSFSITVLTGGTLVGGHAVLAGGDGNYADRKLVISDTGAENDYRVNSPAGEYGILSSSVRGPCGLIYYQAGVAVLTSSVFHPGTGSEPGHFGEVGYQHISCSLTGTTINDTANYTRARIADVSFNNTTELNSTVYFCRANHNDFNYSGNPTYLSQSKMVVKNTVLDEPVSYITTIGLYSADNELLAVAKLSEPLKKTPNNELTLRVRLDY
jgi:hypothetical protein